MSRLRSWALLSAAILAGTIALAFSHNRLFHEARAAACERVDDVRAAAGRVLHDVVAEGALALAAWEPGTEPPSPFREVRRVSAGQPWEWMSPFDAGAVRVAFVKGDLLVAVPVGGGVVEGTIDALHLRAALADAPDVGPPGERSGGDPARFSALGFADSHGQAQWRWRLEEEEAEPDEPSTLEQQKARLFGDDSKPPKVLRNIAADRPDEYETGGIAQSYKGFSGNKVYGTWERWEPAPELWTFAEIDESVADVGVPGLRLEYEGKVLVVILWWHLGIGLSVLALIGTGWAWLRSRNEQLGVIIRTLGFVRPYMRGVALVLFLGLISQGVAATKVLFSAAIFDWVLVDTTADAIQRLWVIGIGLALVAVIAGVTTYFHQYMGGYYQVGIMADVRLAIGRKLAELPISFHDRFRTGDLISRIERDAMHLRKVLNLAFKTVAIEPFKLGWAAVFAFVLNSGLALVLLGLPLLMGPLFRIMRRIKKRAKKRQEQRAEISHVLVQLLAGIKVVKAFAGEQREAERLDAANREMVKTARKVAKLGALAHGMLDALQMLGAAIVLVAGGYLILTGGVTTGELVGFMIVLQQFYTGSKRLTTTANQIVDASAGIERVYEILDTKSDLLDGPNVMQRAPLQRSIRLEGVHFSYRNQEILHGIDLEIPAGQVVALVGPTGAGKSTVCSLVARFYDVTEGRVTYDGVDVREYTVRSLVDNLGIVTQDAFLFNTTVEENIRYGRADATREEIEQAARDAFVHDEIMSMEKRYAKVVGERGAAVSGGQRQRITIARALLADAPVLILDEATSALDSHAEQQVQSALERLMAGRTVLVVAHRLSTIMHADKVVVLDGGRVVEEGAPQDLLADPNGRFRRMYDVQMGSANGLIDPAPAD